MQFYSGIFEFGFAAVFQLINLVLIFGVIYLIYYLIFVLPKRIKNIESTVENNTKMLNLIYEKLEEQENRNNKAE